MDVRKYKDYGDYLDHQKLKLDRKTPLKLWKKAWRRYEEQFKPLFETFLKFMYFPCRVLCLGARLGEEVIAWESLGARAVGIDLNPGPGNVFVLKGDFHYIPFRSSSFDFIYTNSLDHCLYLDLLSHEMFRVLKLNGRVFLDLRKPRKVQLRKLSYWESFLWKDEQELISTLRKYDKWKEFIIYPHIYQTYSVLIVKK